VLAALREGSGDAAGDGGSAARAEAPLLESMLRALAREPSRLDAVAQVVKDLAQIEGGLSRLPPGFLEAWEPIRAAREALEGNKP